MYRKKQPFNVNFKNYFQNICVSTYKTEIAIHSDLVTALITVKIITFIMLLYLIVIFERQMSSKTNIDIILYENIFE